MMLWFSLCWCPPNVAERWWMSLLEHAEYRRSSSVGSPILTKVGKFKSSWPMAGEVPHECDFIWWKGHDLWFPWGKYQCPRDAFGWHWLIVVPEGVPSQNLQWSILVGLWSLISPDSCMRLTSPQIIGQTSFECPKQNGVHEPMSPWKWCQVYRLYLWFSKFDSKHDPISTPCLSRLTNWWSCWVRIGLL